MPRKDEWKEIPVLCCLGWIILYMVVFHVLPVAGQPLPNETSGYQTGEPIISVPGWIKNNTAMWAQGKIADEQFILGMRYLATNNIIVLPSQFLNLPQKPVPVWVKDVAGWWAEGGISNYDFVSDIEFLILNGEINIGSNGNQSAMQDSLILQKNFPVGKIMLDKNKLDVQIADTPDRMTEGLQFQQPLAYSQGMIFVFPQPQMVAMWMKDMQFPLDMVWFDSDGNVIHIEKNLPPCQESMPCNVYDGGSQDTRYVLEVTAGYVDKFNVTESSKLTIIGKL